MSFSRVDNGAETLVSLEGTLDGVHAPEFQQLAAVLVSEGRRNITLETSKLRLLDEDGAAAIMSLSKHVHNSGGTTHVVGLRDQPRALVHMLKLDRVPPFGSAG